MTAQNFAAAIADKLKTFDRQGAEEICGQLTAHLYQSADPFDTKLGGKIMQDLRNKRMFDLMLQVGDAFIQTAKAGFKIRKLYAQALIDQNNLTAASLVVNQLVADTKLGATADSAARAEEMEARGLMGRIFKQLYINAGGTPNPQSQHFLRQGIKAYYEVYALAPEQYTWHGINAVALLARAAKENIAIDEWPDPENLAAAILQTIRRQYDQKKADPWDFATAAEACIALDDPKNALEWISGYAKMPDADAFNLASTLRQLEEVWQLDMDSETGRLVLPILRAELLQRTGGTVVLEARELQQQAGAEQTYKALVSPSAATPRNDLEKVFSTDSYVSYEWYRTGLDRCFAVARISRKLAQGGFGTGFLLRGKALHDSLGEELLVLTNAHVVSNDEKEKALFPDEAVITFEGLNSSEKFYPAQIVWSSPSLELDATLLRFDEENRSRLEALTNTITIYPVAPRLPVIDEEAPQRIYIIGHPAGGSLQWSLHDNVLLDCQDPRIHYRTPTVGGSSGSPVFNQQWELIGLHHAGSRQMPRLNGKDGHYEANEGIWIQAIKKALHSFLTGG